MNQNRVEPAIHTVRARTVEEEREGWAFDIAKRVLPAIVHKESYAPDFAAELAYEYADAFLAAAAARAAHKQKIADTEAIKQLRVRAMDARKNAGRFPA
jgi:hypothetical protein